MSAGEISAERTRFPTKEVSRPFLIKNLGKVFQKRISKTLQDQFGGQLKVAISGAPPQ